MDSNTVKRPLEGWDDDQLSAKYARLLVSDTPTTHNQLVEIEEEWRHRHINTHVQVHYTNGEFCSCGQDTCICQKCGKITCGMQAEWVAGTGNVCATCRDNAWRENLKTEFVYLEQRVSDMDAYDFAESVVKFSTSVAPEKVYIHMCDTSEDHMLLLANKFLTDDQVETVRREEQE